MIASEYNNHAKKKVTMKSQFILPTEQCESKNYIKKTKTQTKKAM